MKILIKILCICSITMIPEYVLATKNNVISSLKAGMNYQTQRQSVLAENIAHANMPNYKAKDLKKVQLNKLSKFDVASSGINMSVTSPYHINSNKKSSNTYKLEKMKSTYETSPQGNNVVLEEQMMLVSENNMDYQFSTNTYKKLMSFMKLSTGSK